MKDLFVPYKIACKLRELGFNEPCFGFYHEKCYENKKANCSGKFQNMCGWVLGRENTDDLSSHDFLIVAPLYQQVIDWLEKKHRLWIYVVPYGDGKSWSFSGVNNIDDKNMYTRTDWEVREKYRDVKFSSRLKAVHTGFEEAFKIVENNKVNK